MQHTLEVRPHRYSWQKSDARTPVQRLKRFYKEHPGVIRFINFPLAHQWTKQAVQYQPGGRVYYEDRAIPGHLALTFDASVWDVTQETFAHPFIDPSSLRRYSVPTMRYVQHVFWAPFKKENEKLLLSDVQLRLSATPEVSVLLDWCMENSNLKVGRDFDFSKERQVVVKSDDLRLILAEKLGEWPEFDMTFIVNHPDSMSMSVTIDDLKAETSHVST